MGRTSGATNRMSFVKTIYIYDEDRTTHTSGDV